MNTRCLLPLLLVVLLWTQTAQSQEGAEHTVHRG